MTESGGGQSIPSLLVSLGETAELCHDKDGNTYATINRETREIRSREFRNYLGREYHKRTGKVAKESAIRDALIVLEGIALNERPELPIYTRLGELDGAIYWYLGDSQRTVIRIGPDGWEADPSPPVRFRHPKGLLGLPLPERGGSLDELKDLLRVPSEDWPLAEGWMVAAMRPNAPQVPMVLTAEQGSTKSTTMSAFRSVVDPNAADRRPAPSNLQDLSIAAEKGWVLSFDNLSKLPDWLSDAFCRLSTGGGFGTRELYTDAEERLFEARRPVIINGIEELITKADLRDRAIVIEMPSIPDDERRDEASFWKAFEEARPRILGALLDRVSRALKELPRVRDELSEWPRMADFAMWATAAEPEAHRGEFMRAYKRNTADGHDRVLEAEIIAAPLIAYLREAQDFYGTASDLLTTLNARVEPSARRLGDWPKDATRLSNRLRRIVPNLRAAGACVDFESGYVEGRRSRLIRIDGASLACS